LCAYFGRDAPVVEGRGELGVHVFQAWGQRLEMSRCCASRFIFEKVKAIVEIRELVVGAPVKIIAWIFQIVFWIDVGRRRVGGCHRFLRCDATSLSNEIFELRRWGKARMRKLPSRKLDTTEM
jgi:hypothetical protein